MVRFLLLVAFLPLNATAADVVQPGEERFTFMLGAFLPAFRSDMKVDNDRTPGDRFNLGDDLGVDESTSGAWLGAEWRFSPNHRLGFTYSRFTLSGERAIDRQLQIGGNTYPVGADLNTQLRLEIVPITYSYSLIRNADNELALTAGLHWSRLSFRVEGSATLASRNGTRDEAVSANVPLPLIGVRYDHNFTERWSAGTSLGIFALRYGEEVTHYKGSLVSLRLHGEYRFARNWGVGAAVDGFQVRIEADQESWRGGFDYRYWGPQVYLTARF